MWRATAEGVEPERLQVNLLTGVPKPAEVGAPLPLVLRLEEHLPLTGPGGEAGRSPLLPLLLSSIPLLLSWHGPSIAAGPVPGNAVPRGCAKTMCGCAAGVGSVSVVQVRRLRILLR